jgi:hypothetical protein
MFRTAFPDLHCTIQDEIIQNNKVAAHWTIRGTHKGQFLGNSPTNKPIAVQGLLYARIENGQVIENHLLIDQMGVLQQLGLIPPPRPTAVLRGESTSISIFPNSTDPWDWITMIGLGY